MGQVARVGAGAKHSYREIRGFAERSDGAKRASHKISWHTGSESAEMCTVFVVFAFFARSSVRFFLFRHVFGALLSSRLRRASRGYDQLGRGECRRMGEPRKGCLPRRGRRLAARPIGSRCEGASAGDPAVMAHRSRAAGSLYFYMYIYK